MAIFPSLPAHQLRVQRTAPAAEGANPHPQAVDEAAAADAAPPEFDPVAFPFPGLDLEVPRGQQELNLLELQLARPGAVGVLDPEVRSLEGPEARLLERTEANDPTVTCVSMWQSKNVDVPPGAARTVFTFGLGGCTAVALLTLHRDGTRSVSLSHYPPTHRQQQLQDIQRALGSRSHGGEDAVRHEVFIVAPEGHAQDAAGTWQTTAPVVEDIVRTVQSRVSRVAPHVLSYSQARGYGDSRAFVLNVPASAEEPIRYEGTHFGRCAF